jgi:tetratricopeptide (TPR) repeat protein
VVTTIAAAALWLAAAQGQEPAALSSEAAARFRAQDLQTAVELFQKADKLSPLTEESRFTLAMAHIALNQRDAARSELSRLRPTPLHLYWLGRLDAIGGNYQGAIARYRQSLSLNPAFWRAHDGIGLAMQAMHRYYEAEAAFRRAIRSNDVRSPWPTYNLGAMFASIDKYPEAEEMLSEALQLDPAFSKAHYQMGRISEKHGNFTEAAGRYRIAARNADTPDVFYALHRVLRKLGDDAGATAALERFRQMKQTCCMAH